MASLSERIKELRTSQGILQQALADSLGLSLRGYQRYERGERFPTADVLLDIANFFQVSTDYLMGVSSSKERLP